MSVCYAVRIALLLQCAIGDDVSLYQTVPHTVHSSLKDPEGPFSRVLDSERKFHGVHMRRDSATDNATAEVQLEEAKCSDLQNVGPYSMIDLQVGTPPQGFSVVADTGSDLVIIQDCSCSLKGLGCSSDDQCFKESSTTFSKDGVQNWRISFASGDVVADTGSDVVQINGVSAKLDKGIVLMMDRRGLDVASKFEGILGLGPSPLTGEPLFLEEAKEKYFSICFNDYDIKGAMRVAEEQAAKNVLHVAGTKHWALSFEGLAVGDGSGAASVDLCNSKPAGQTYPCGAVFDTGTTYILGPQHKIRMIYASICDAWPRCKEAHTSGSAKEQVFTDLVSKCGEWLDKHEGLNELPTLQFMMAGANGAKQTLELSGWAYIFEEAGQRKKKSSGLPNCVPAFDDNDGYTTAEHGDVWIMGSPIFFDYVVGHHMDTPGMSFDKTTCNACGAGASHLLDRKRHRRFGARAQPRPQIGKARRGIVPGSPL